MYSSVVLEKNIDVNEHFYLLILCLYKYLVREKNHIKHATREKAINKLSYCLLI